MRSLTTIRSRVERLTSGWPTSPETFLISRQGGNTRCPACDADLKDHAAETALAVAVAGQRPGNPPPRGVWYSTDELTACPRCDAALP